jgi:RNA-binding protein YlmH
MLPQRELLEGSPRAQELAAVVEAAQRSLHNWEPAWSAFLDGGLCEEAVTRLGVLSELRIDRNGGHRAAERCRLLFQRAEAALHERDELEQVQVHRAAGQQQQGRHRSPPEARRPEPLPRLLCGIDQFRVLARDP